MLPAADSHAIGGSVVGAAIPNGCGDEVFHVSPSAANTKTDSTTIYARTRTIADLRVRYGEEENADTAWTVTGTTTTTANALTQITLPSLTQNTRYYYRVDCRLPASGGQTPPWRSLPLQTFKTLGTAGTPRTFTDVVTADPHWVPALGDFFNCRNPGTKLTFALAVGDPWGEMTAANRLGLEKAQIAMSEIGSIRPVNYFDLGDFYHTHRAKDDCFENNLPLYTQPWSTNNDDYWADTNALADIRMQFALDQIKPARAQSTFWLVRGNHDNSWGPNVTALAATSSTASCGHSINDSAISIARQDTNLPNHNNAYPALAQGATSGGANYDEKAAFYAFNQAQVTYIAVNEYHYACENPGASGNTVSCASLGLPDDVDDWTIGAIQRAWLDNMDAGNPSSLELGDVVVVMSHHPFGGHTNGTPGVSGNCYFYGRAHPYATTTGQAGDDWLGEEEWLHDKMKTWAASGKTVIRLYGHDHRFGFLGTRENVHYFVLGQPGNDGSNWTGGTVSGFSHDYMVDFDVAPTDTVLDWEVSTSDYYAPKEGDEDFWGFLTLNYDAAAATSVNLKWHTWYGSDAWVYQLTPTSVTRISP